MSVCRGARTRMSSPITTCYHLSPPVFVLAASPKVSSISGQEPCQPSLAVLSQVRYRPDLAPVLKGLSFSIKAREKIGVVGRTGCGKSTLTSTLFRITEPCGGRMLIDGVDLAQVPLSQLRSKLALVPQVCFTDAHVILMTMGSLCAQ